MSQHTPSISIPHSIDELKLVDISGVVDAIQGLTRAFTAAVPPQIQVTRRGTNATYAFGRQTLRDMRYEKALEIFYDTFKRPGDPSLIRPSFITGYISSHYSDLLTVAATFHQTETLNALTQAAMIIHPSSWSELLHNVDSLEVIFNGDSQSRRFKPEQFHLADASTTVSLTASSPNSTGAPSAATEFVKTSGTQFTLNGSKYTVVGTNAYWIGLIDLSETDMNQAFADMAKGGATTVRTFGFNDVKSANGIYYQLWTESSATVNTGSTGLQNFDKVVAAARANGIRLIVALINNWSDYGGMDVYVSQIVGPGQPHDLFYTDTNIKSAFKNYIKTFVGRYANEPTILGWELAHEPRCRSISNTASSSCTPATITIWAKEISAYIKSIDSNHLVAIGDEGFYNTPDASTYPYQGGEGIDFDVNLAISTLDFGTFHSYPEKWGQSSNIQNWGTKWIADHAISQNRIGKPVIIEAYGVTTNKPVVYDAWLSQVFSSGLAGSLYWQAGSRLPSRSTHDDGYTIYPDDPAFSTVQLHAAALKAR